MSNIQFFNFKEYKSMPYIPYDSFQRSPIQYEPIQHIRMNSIQNSPRVRPQTIHPYTNIIDNPYLIHQQIKITPLNNSIHTADEFSTKLPVTDLNPHTKGVLYSNLHRYKLKRNVSWKNENLVGFTFSKDEYDRTIDSLQIRKNIEEIRQYHLAKMQPLMRQPSVSEDLFDMDLERDNI